MQLNPGQRLRSASSEAEVIVIRAPKGEVHLTCAGAPMIPFEQAQAAGAAAPADAPPLLIGKRYCDEEGTLELLCTRGGAGPLAAGSRELAVKAAKPLPASD
ncbi:hypothetical protein HNP84_009549 [Thermocatellispora tengchongensis]|uniref:Uncharacterized protein n=1 Tax=Thermocatellispora tengchongensis TaxID=1073253 RepID=A0A840PV68_9ACTN|nr:hypothetical protein [Thermocatellispora tengchongensis]MBB5139785.1 hypothetical protein [Thermocatellispora tengchongensis]